jgi:hypothetical protein
LEAAQLFHSLGLNVIAQNDQKRPIHPYAHLVEQRQTTEDLNRLPWSRAKGIAVMLGSISGDLVCIDFDKQPDARALAEFLIALHLPADYEWVDITPGGGQHVYLRVPGLELEHHSKKYDRPGVIAGHIELRAHGILATLPPSLHPSGKRYRFAGTFPNQAPAVVAAELVVAAYEQITIAPEKPAAPAPQIYQPNDLPSEAAELLKVESRARAEIARHLVKRGTKPGVYHCPLDHGREGKDFLFNPEAEKPIGGCQGKHAGQLTRWVDLALHLGIDVKDIARDVAREGRKIVDAKSGEQTPSNKAKRKPAPLETQIQPVNIPTLQSHETAQLRYISDLPTTTILDRGCVLIKSPVGTGKTELVKRLIADLDQNNTASVLVITHRQALAADIARRLDIECYKTIPDHMLSKAHRLVISYNSLYKIGTRRQWDLVVIDEIEQFHQHLFGGTFRGGEAHRAYQVLTGIMAQASHFIGLDAHLTPVAARWVHGVTRSAPYIIRNDYRHSWGRLILHADESGPLQAALQAAQERQGPVVVTTSSLHRSYIYERFITDVIGPEGVLLVNGENSSGAQIQHFIENINAELPNLRVLICTPSFGTGLDVTARVYGVFGIMLNRPLIATDMIQMMGRFRQAERREIYVQHLHQTETRDSVDLYGDIMLAAAETRQAADFAHYGIKPIPASQHQILSLYAQMRAAADIQRVDLVSTFVAYAQAEGFELAFNNQRDRAIRTTIQAVAKTLADEKKARVLAATPVSREDYERHQINGTLTPEIEAGYQRWKIENTLGETITNRIYDDLHRADRRQAVRRLADLLDNPEQLKTRDRLEAADQVLLSSRGHYTSTQALIHAALSVVFGTDSVNSRAELTEAEINERLKPFVKAHLDHVQRFLDQRDDLSSDPIFVLRRILKRIGLKLGRQRVRRNNERLWLYALDDENREQWLAYARARLAHLARIEALSTNAEDRRVFRESGQTAPQPVPYDKPDSISPSNMSELRLYESAAD